MNLRLKIFLFIIWAIVFVFLFHKVKSKKVDIKYILPWIFLDFLMCIVTAFPVILSKMCVFFGIETPSNMLFFFGMIFLVMIVFSMSLTISRLNDNIKDLTQQMALHEISEK